MSFKDRYPEVRVYRIDDRNASACAPKDLPVEAVEGAVNRRHPRDTPWKRSSDESFRGGEPIPFACGSDPDRLHWLLEC